VSVVVGKDRGRARFEEGTDRDKCICFVVVAAGKMECCVAMSVLHVDRGSDKGVLQQALHAVELSIDRLDHERGHNRCRA